MSLSDDITIDSDDETLEGEGSSADKLSARLKKLREDLSKANKEKQEYLEGWQRAKADYVNVRKRSEEERGVLVRSASLSLVKEMLPALDSFEQALASMEGNSAWLEGVKNTHAQLLQALAKEGVVAINSLGEIFNPMEHEPVETVAVETAKEDNTVTKVHQKGYALNGIIIRPARVAVGHYKKAGS